MALRCVFLFVCLRAEVKWHRVHPAAHPMVNTQPRSRASEDQSCREKGQQLTTVTQSPGSDFQSTTEGEVRARYDMMWLNRYPCLHWAEVRVAEADGHCWDMGFHRHQSQHAVSAGRPWPGHPEGLTDPRPLQNPQTPVHQRQALPVSACTAHEHAADCCQSPNPR